ncbi:hypothetical protein [Brachyspira hyodysenteriae]|uniref:hypothetical protein n=1 Tax=Brachyspira hyodysenteriae TaxID=159 RepID=UPI00063D9D29|nr:hypothetical protein [Brachyspira hyodysenteriae]KLI46122.1 hypothetical protein SZ41_12195 [Brachyspira hyodysenteriae]KLI53637.1 hypothetical protein SZ42_00670 [Brachyspira hyodysenteriae]
MNENIIKDKIKALDKKNIINNIEVSIEIATLLVNIWINDFFLIECWKDNTMSFDIDSEDENKSMIYDDTVDRPEYIVDNIDNYINTIAFFKKNKNKIQNIMREEFKKVEYEE